MLPIAFPGRPDLPSRTAPRPQTAPHLHAAAHIPLPGCPSSPSTSSSLQLSPSVLCHWEAFSGPHCAPITPPGLLLSLHSCQDMQSPVFVSASPAVEGQSHLVLHSVPRASGWTREWDSCTHLCSFHSPTYMAVKVTHGSFTQTQKERMREKQQERDVDPTLHSGQMDRQQWPFLTLLCPNSLQPVRGSAHGNLDKRGRY